MAIELNQSPADLFAKYQVENVGISYTGLIYNLDVGYGTTNLYNPDKNRFIEYQILIIGTLQSQLQDQHLMLLMV